MSYDPYTAVKFASFDVAMKAKINDLSQADVDDLRNAAERTIKDPSDALRRAVIGFVTQYEMHRFDKEVLKQLGEHLHDFVSTLNNPAPELPWTDRVNDSTAELEGLLDSLSTSGGAETD